MIQFLVQQNNLAVEYASSKNLSRKTSTSLSLLPSSKRGTATPGGDASSFDDSSYQFSCCADSCIVEARLSDAIKFSQQKSQQVSTGRREELSYSSSSFHCIPVIDLSSFSAETRSNRCSNSSSYNKKRNGSYTQQVFDEEGTSAFTAPIALSLENVIHYYVEVNHSSSSSSTAHSLHEIFSFKIINATLLFNMGIFKARKYENTAAKSYFKEALEVLLEMKEHVLDSITATATACSMKKKLLATHKLLTSITLLNLGHVYWHLSLPDNSIRSYQQCLESLKGIESSCELDYEVRFHGRHIMATCLNCIGMVFMYEKVLPSCQAKHNTHELQSQAESCLKYLEASISVYEDCKSDDIVPHDCMMAFKANMATTLNNLGRVCYIINDFSQALHHQRACLRERSAFLSSTNLDLNVAHFNVAQSLKALDENEEALEHYHTFLSNATPILGYDHSIIIRAVTTVSDLYIDMEDYYGAETLLQEYLSSSAFVSTESLQSKLTLLNSLSTVLDYQDKFEDALDALTKAHNIILALPQDESATRSYITNCCNIAVILSKDQKIEKAVIMFHKALERIVSVENPMQFSKVLIEIHMNMANMFESIGNYSICTMHLEKTVTIAKTLYGPLDPFVSTYLNQLGLMYYKEQKFATALTAFMESLHIRTNCNKNSKNQINAVMYNIATVYNAMGMTEKALTVYRRVLIYERQIIKEQQGRSQPKDLIHTLRHIFQIYKEQGIPKDGLKYLLEAVDLCRQYKDKIDTDLGQSIFFLMGEYLTLTQEVTDGFRYYCEGCELFGEVDDDILYAAGENGLRLVLAQLCTNEKIFPIHAAAA